MKAEWKRLPLLDVELVKFLRKKYPPLEYSLDSNSDEFIRDAIYRAGQREVINTIDHIIELQRKGTSNGS